MDFRSGNGTMSNLWDFKAKIDYVDNWLLMESPIPMLTIWMSYLLFVLKLGPNFMKNRTAYNLKRLLIVYNIFQMVYSAYIVYAGLQILKSVNYIFLSCANEETMQKITSAIHLYILGKISELLDTIFFVLRKKQKQVSFLHVYHHVFIIMYSWLTLKFEPSYSTIFGGTINSFVHVIMYGYYGLSIFPSFAKYLWWKKYITWIQLVQFALAFIHAVGNFIMSECPPSTALLATTLFTSLSFSCLFADFYTKSYLKNTKNVEATTNTSNGEKVKKVK